jgi:hypothetical protein
MKDSTRKHSCDICARRKVKCDRLSPCSNCSKAESECVYGTPVPSQRHRKRPADEDLLSKLREYEQLLQKNNVPFEPLDNSWIPSPLEEKLVTASRTTCPSNGAGLGDPAESNRPAEAQSLEPQSQPRLPVSQSESLCLWSELPKEVCIFLLISLVLP